MSDRKLVRPVAFAVGAALAGAFAITGVASADTGASPFAMTTLSAGYMLGAGEGSCGGNKEDSEGQCGGDKEGKDAEGKCGGDKEDKAGKDAEGKCGEGKCGASV
jgi:uncharacterized low-complexity protein